MARPGKTRRWNWILVCLSLYTKICFLGNTALFTFSILTLKSKNWNTVDPLLTVKILQPFYYLLGAWNQQMDWRFFSSVWENYRVKEDLQRCSFAIYQLDHTQLWGTILTTFPGRPLIKLQPRKIRAASEWHSKPWQTGDLERWN